MLFKCQWCGMTLEGYDSYEDHINMHASVDLLNGKSFRCPHCKIVIIETFEDWDLHQKAHRQAADRDDSCQPSSPKRAKSDEDRGFDTSSSKMTIYITKTFGLRSQVLVILHHDRLGVVMHLRPTRLS